MLKRIFWLAVAAAAGWFAWQWLRQRRGEFADTAPHFAPPRPLEGYAQPPAQTPAPAARPDPDEAIEAAPSPPEPAADSAAISLETPEAPPPALEGAAGPATTEPATAEEVRGREPGAAEGASPDEDEGQDRTEADAAEEAPRAPRPAAAPAPASYTASENERATIEASSAGLPIDAKPLEEEVVGYCVRCKTKRPIQEAHEEITETGRRAARGVCPVCGANMFTFLKDGEDEDEVAAGEAE
jgi:hypothetical protein